jgi:hypothetical protein
MELRQARAADWKALRELRLRALAKAPDAFASTLQEAAFPEKVWRQRAGGGATSANFIAWVDGAGVGMAAIFAVVLTCLESAPSTRALGDYPPAAVPPCSWPCRLVS